MFKKRNEFDEVRDYKNQQEQNNQEDTRFDKRDDYTFESERAETQDNTKKLDKPKKKRSEIFAFIFWVIIMGFSAFTLFFEGDNDSYVVDEFIEKNNFSNKIIRQQKIDAQEFVKLYEKAKKNKLEYKRISKIYLSGDYKQPHIANTLYLKNMYNGDTSYLCLENNEGNEQILLMCGQENIYNSLENPYDFIEAVQKNNDDSENAQIKLYNYSSYSSEYKEMYFINGFYYTKELADMIVHWEKTGNLK